MFDPKCPSLGAVLHSFCRTVLHVFVDPFYGLLLKHNGEISGKVTPCLSESRTLPFRKVDLAFSKSMPLRHDKAEHPERYVKADDKRKCAHCKATKGLDEFRNENVTCNRCLEVNKGAQSKSPEMKAVYNNEYRENIRMTNITANAVINP